MNEARVREIADAVLYEGYMLYPYRPTATKNRQRWTFGGLCPRAYSEATNGSEPWQMRCECLALGDVGTRLRLQLRFLHLQTRSVAASTQLSTGGAAFTPVAELTIDERTLRPWEEAVEREIAIPPTLLRELTERPLAQTFAFASARERERLRDRAGTERGVFERERKALTGELLLAAQRIAAGVYRLAVEVSNVTPLADAPALSRDGALLQAFASTHLILALDGGSFVSQTDPPDELREQASACRNLGLWPVLVGDEPERDAMLAAPIILYDYPQIAPESPGALFDGTEIDEILTLRILTLTEDERRELRGVDDRTRALLERSEALSPHELARLHGTLRTLRPSGEMRA